MADETKMPCTAGCREETAGFVEDDPLCTTLDNLCEALDSWRETLENPWQREDRAYRKELAENIQALVRLMLEERREDDEREQAVPEFMGGIQSTRAHTWPGGKADRREPGHAEQQDEW